MTDELLNDNRKVYMPVQLFVSCSSKNMYRAYVE